MGPSEKKPDRSAQPIPGYDILERVGSGGAGTVFKARQVSMNRIVALKILKKSELRDPLPLDRLRREALIIARMDHPNIVKGIDMGESGRYYFFVMEFIEGRSVKAALDLFGPMEEVRAGVIVREVVKALRYAFDRKLTHRDIKPGNILISDDGQVKLTDLGLAKGESDLTITREGTTVGTPQYIAPEQARNPKSADIRSDIYSLGATFYHMVTGRMPFEGDTMAEVLTKVLFGRPPLPEAVRPGVNQGTSRVISRMMAKDPRRRYQTPGELLDDLDILIESLQEGSKELANFIGMNWKESQRGPWLRKRHLLAGGAALAVLLSALFLLFGDGETDDPGTADPTAALLEIREGYETGEILPAQVLRRLSGLPSGSDPVRIRELRRRVLDDCRRILADLLQPTSPRYGKALAEGGFSGATARLKVLASRDAELRLGDEPSRFSPEVQSFWTEKLEEAGSSLSQRIRREEEKLLESALGALRDREGALRGQIGAGALEEAWVGIQDLEGRGEALLMEAAEGFSRSLGSATPSAEEFVTKEALGRIRSEAGSGADELEADLRREIRKAHEEYLDAVEAEALSLAGKADLDQIALGADDLLRIARDRAAAKRPWIPPDLADQFPDGSSLREAVGKALSGRRSVLLAERAGRFEETLLGEMEERLAREDFEGALRRLESAAADHAADQDFLRRWRGNIEALSTLEDSALKALAEYQGLEVRLNTPRIGYEGKIRQVNRESKEIILELRPGQTLAVRLEDLVVTDVIAWCGRIKLVPPLCKGLYAYFRGDLESARSYLNEAGEAPGAEWYLARIGERIHREEMTRETAGRELELMLDAVEEDLEAGRWKEGLERLAAIKHRYRGAPGWSETRRRREGLAEGLDALRIAAEEEERIRELFSVPVELLGEGRVRVTYPFDGPNEMKDFDGHGQAWRIQEGVLFCGAAPESAVPDFFHNVPGIRLGSPFETGEPLSVSLDYRPPLEGTGPCFMGISIFGGCIGIRSVHEEKGTGQVNAWIGDLDAYGDYFYFPDLGETRPKKGRTRPFSFSRGEWFRIEIDWIPGAELLMRVDGKEIYRLNPYKAELPWIEIKTLKQAEIDNLTLEGKLRHD